MNKNDSFSLEKVLKVVTQGYSKSSNTELLNAYNVIKADSSTTLDGVKDDILIELGKRYAESLNQNPTYKKIHQGAADWVIGDWNDRYEIEEGIISGFNIGKYVSIMFPFRYEGYRWDEIDRIVFFDKKSAINALREIKANHKIIE